MTEILNLSSLCRCCHTDGDLKQLDVPCWIEEINKTYCVMLHETFGVDIERKLPKASYFICNKCILRLCDAYLFKCQVWSSEEKFQEYCRNEEALASVTDDIKSEPGDQQHDVLKVENEDIKIEFDYDGAYVEDDVSQTEPHETNTSYENKSSGGIKDKQKVVKKTKQMKPTQGKKKEQIKKPIACYRNRIPHRLTVRQKFEQSFEITHESGESITYSCKLCGGSYKDCEELKDHIVKKHSLYDCVICKKICRKLKYWGEHAKRHAEKKLYTCVSCNENFESSEPIHYRCDVCKKTFIHKYTLAIHMKKHLGTHRRVPCDICGWTFNDVSNMRAHKQTVHEKLRPYCCKICKKRVATKKSLKNHMNIHYSMGLDPSQPIASMVCEFCGKHYAFKPSLERHRLTHENIYQCKHCKQNFDDKDLYISHIKAHKRNAPKMKCDICGKGFMSKYTLRMHIAVHTGLRAYGCDTCGKRFTQKYCLERHRLRIHLSSKQFRVKSNKEYPCELCGALYRHMGTLRRHQRIKHKKNNMDA